MNAQQLLAANTKICATHIEKTERILFAQTWRKRRARPEQYFSAFRCVLLGNEEMIRAPFDHKIESGLKCAIRCFCHVSVLLENVCNRTLGCDGSHGLEFEIFVTNRETEEFFVLLLNISSAFCVNFFVFHSFCSVFFVALFTFQIFRLSSPLVWPLLLPFAVWFVIRCLCCCHCRTANSGSKCLCGCVMLFSRTTYEFHMIFHRSPQKHDLPEINETTLAKQRNEVKKKRQQPKLTCGLTIPNENIIGQKLS